MSTGTLARRCQFRLSGWKSGDSPFGSIFKFMLGGMNGTVLSGAAQFGKTLILRSLFGWVWNFCSSQELDMPAFDTVLKGLPPNPAA